MSVARVLAHYETLASLSRQMREAAQGADWDALIACEQQRGELVAAIKPLDAATRLDEGTRNRKHELIEHVLAHDAETRKLVQAWMDECDQSMQSNAQELRLLKKYSL